MPALLFAVAMGLHIFATDNVLAEHFPVRLTADGGSCSPEGRSPVGSSPSPFSPQELR
jgi:hypothetical protein